MSPHHIGWKYLELLFTRIFGYPATQLWLTISASFTLVSQTHKYLLKPAEIKFISSIHLLYIENV